MGWSAKAQSIKYILPHKRHKNNRYRRETKHMYYVVNEDQQKNYLNDANTDKVPDMTK